jgi:hypothetical protein
LFVGGKMATFKYWKNEGYIREYECGKIEDLNQNKKWDR